MTPTKQGQICKLINPFPDENPAETYLITEDVSKFSDDTIIYVASITDLIMIEIMTRAIKMYISMREG